MSDPRSESENPVIDAPEPKPNVAQDESGLVAESAGPLQVLHQHLAPREPDGRGLRLRRRVQDPRRRRPAKRDIFEVMTTSQEWWPADYGHYGPLVHPDELARRGHVPHRPTAAVVAAAALQRFGPLNSWPDNAEPRQGAPVAVADQAEVRPQDLLGRPDGLRRRLRLRVDGVQTFRFGFRRGDIWEPEEVFWGPEDTWLGDERYSGPWS